MVRPVFEVFYDKVWTQTEIYPGLAWVKNRLIDPAKSGHGDILMNLKMGNGHIAEFRLHLKQVDELAEMEHALYEVTRSFDAVAGEQNRPLTAMEQAIKIATLQRTRELYRDAFAAAWK